MKKAGLDGKIYDFSVIYEAIDVSDIEAIYEHLMKKQNILKMPEFINSTLIYRTGLDFLFWWIIGY